MSRRVPIEAPQKRLTMSRSAATIRPMPRIAESKRSVHEIEEISSVNYTQQTTENVYQPEQSAKKEVEPVVVERNAFLK